MSLPQLPLEIVLLILDTVSCRKTLLNFRQTCRCCHQHINSFRPNILEVWVFHDAHPNGPTNAELSVPLASPLDILDDSERARQIESINIWLCGDRCRRWLNTFEAEPILEALRRAENVRTIRYYLKEMDGPQSPLPYLLEDPFQVEVDFHLEFFRSVEKVEFWCYNNKSRPWLQQKRSNREWSWHATLTVKTGIAHYLNEV
jgi:hypothetical protein